MFFIDKLTETLVLLLSKFWYSKKPQKQYSQKKYIKLNAKIINYYYRIAYQSIYNNLLTPNNRRQEDLDLICLYYCYLYQNLYLPVDRPDPADLLLTERNSQFLLFSGCIQVFLE